MENLYPIGLPDAIYNDSDFKASADRLAVLATLEDGWLWGSGQAITEATVRRASDIMTELWQRKLLPPTIYASEEGGLQLEWHFLKNSILKSRSVLLVVPIYEFGGLTGSMISLRIVMGVLLKMLIWLLLLKCCEIYENKN
jgi:hypothetical protein